jgi:hypothetical protein
MCPERETGSVFSVSIPLPLFGAGRVPPDASAHRCGSSCIAAPRRRVRTRSTGPFAADAPQQ